VTESVARNIARRLEAVFPFVLAALGLFMASHATILSGLSRMQTDPLDTRHMNHVLEHGYRWLTGHPGHTELWNPPIFYPEKNVAAYSETLLGVQPFYAPWRLLGFAPDTSLQLWSFTVSLLNFWAFHALLRRVFRLGTAASSFGAFLFAFGSVRVVQIGHQLLLPQFYAVLAVLACFRVFGRDGVNSPKQRVAWLALFFASVVLQLYGGFNLAWLFVFSLTVCLTWVLLLPVYRGSFLRVLRQNAIAIVILASLSALALLPMLRHYLAAKTVVGYRQFSDVQPMLIPLKAWLYYGEFSWLYGRVARWTFFQMPMEWEKRLGFGIVTSVLVLWGLFTERRRLSVRLLCITALSLAILASAIPKSSGRSLWQIVFLYFPAAGAVRAVARIVLMLLIPASIGLALAFERLARGKRAWSVVPLGLFVLLEQGQSVSSYDKAAARRNAQQIADMLPAGCRAFYYCHPASDVALVYQAHVDAMWAQMLTGVPTVNGYASNLPPAFGTLNDNRVRAPEDRRRIQDALREWMALHDQSADRVCVVEGGAEEIAVQRPGG
jgi:hypothetical protein